MEEKIAKCLIDFIKILIFSILYVVAKSLGNTPLVVIISIVIIVLFIKLCIHIIKVEK